MGRLPLCRKELGAGRNGTRLINYRVATQALETMLASVKKGRKIDEGSIPPPVACGAPSAPPAVAEPQLPPPEQAEEAAEETQAVSPETGPSSEASSTLASPELSCVTSPTEESGSEETAEPHTGKIKSEFRPISMGSSLSTGERPW